LAIAYARRFQIAKAVQVLNQVNAQNDFWAMYFLTKCRILNKDIEGVEEIILDIEMYLNEQKENEGVTAFKRKVQELKETLIRYKTIPNPSTHIWDWHFIQYGGAVLDYFDARISMQSEDVTWQAGVFLKPIHKLKYFLQAHSIHIPT
jgi:hypothetical protein